MPARLLAVRKSVHYSCCAITRPCQNLKWVRTMAEMIHDSITKTTTVPWMPLVEAVGTGGISVKALRVDP